MQAFQQCRISRNFDQLLELSKGNIILKLRGTLAIISDVTVFIIIIIIIVIIINIIIIIIIIIIIS